MGRITSVRNIIKSTIKPSRITEESKKPCYLTPWDISMLSSDYIQKGLFFPKPKTEINAVLDQLKGSLSETLTHFSPLAGRLATKNFDDLPSCSISVDCANPQGAEFVYAEADTSMSEVLSPVDASPTMESFFSLDRANNHDGHHLPLLGVQVTELSDSVFIGCSINHAVADGTSFWHFFSSWSEISKGNTISRPPITKRWFVEGQDPIIKLPYTSPDQFIARYIAPPHRERVFHFSAEAIAQLKARANAECNTDIISSFQALSAHAWRCVTRARQLPTDQETICGIPVDNRTIIEPPLTKDYLGNCILMLRATTTAGNLLDNNLGWSAMMLRQYIKGLTNLEIQGTMQALMQYPFVYRVGEHLNNCNMIIGGSAKFDVYGNDFGWGNPVAVRSGYGNKFDGKMTFYPGYEKGSADMELCLLPESMNALESDKEFMASVSSAELDAMLINVV